MWTPTMKSFVTRLVTKYHKELKEKGYPVRDIREVKFSRSVRTHGKCTIHYDNTVTITISEVAFSGGNEALKNTIFHELTHSIRGCKGHEEVWQRYADEIGRMYGVKIQQYVSKEERVACKEYKESRYNWKVTCPNCGHSWKSYRKTKVIDALMNGRKCTCSCGHVGNDFKVESLKKGVKIYGVR